MEERERAGVTNDVGVVSNVVSILLRRVSIKCRNLRAISDQSHAQRTLGKLAGAP